MRTSRAFPPASAEGVGGKVIVLRADLVPPETCALLTSTARVRLTGGRGRSRRASSRLKEPGPSLVLCTQAPRSQACRRGPARLHARIYSTGSSICRRWKTISSSSAPAGRLQRPGSTSLPTPASDFRCRRKAAALPGRSTAGSISDALVNDPVTDRPGEVIYLRDEESGELWCLDGTANS